jgi:hypothetical protein
MSRVRERESYQEAGILAASAAEIPVEIQAATRAGIREEAAAPEAIPAASVLTVRLARESQWGRTAS